MSPDQLHDKIYASLVLAGIGDALGAPTELWGIDEIVDRFGGLADRFVEPTPDTFAGVNNGRQGEVTDDASQMYYLARALAATGGRLDNKAWVACLLDWADTSPKAAFMGPSTLLLVNALREGGSIERIGVVGDSARKLTTVGNTNGAAMRVAPCGLVNPGDIEAACHLALVTCLPSHDTDVAISSACAIAAGTAVALTTVDPNAVINACRDGGLLGASLARKHARVPPGPRFLTRIEMALEIAARSRDDLHFLHDLEDAIGVSVLAAESVPSAVAIYAYAKGDPLRSITLAATAGNDTDTVATMVGAMAGAMHGRSGLPKQMHDEFLSVNDKEFHFETLASGLAAIAVRNGAHV